MEERGLGLSREALFKFLDFAGEKGLLKKPTAASRKRACEIILGILSESEADDLSKIDLEDIIQRHRNLAAGNIKPKTLVTYESRTRTAMKDFLNYINNPSSWKSSTKQRSGRPPKQTKAIKSTTQAKKLEEPEKREKMPSQPSIHFDLQIHISPEAGPEQIDQLFASIRHHLYPNRTD